MFFLTNAQVSNILATNPELIPFSILDKAYEYDQAISRMHDMYSLPINWSPTLKDERHDSFLKIIRDEVEEGEDIKTSLMELYAARSLKEHYSPEWFRAKEIEILTEYADWLTDLIVYCQSEMLRLGLGLRLTHPIVMNSNFTKLDEDGNPIKNPETGKVEKGPNFKRPEPTLSAVIAEAIRLAQGDLSGNQSNSN